MADTIAQLDAEVAAIHRRVAALQAKAARLDARRAELAEEVGDFGALYVAPAIAFADQWAVYLRHGGAWAVQCRSKREACRAARDLLARIPAERWNPATWEHPATVPSDVLEAVYAVRGAR